jgi:pimeloyl-ACP methyl ester carboxylesterase
VIDGVPLLAGYRWHWIARIWRRRGLGELLNALASRAAVGQLLRLGRPGYAAMPSEFVDVIWECWDRRMAGAVLRLYRSADPDALEAAGAHLDRLRCPALVAWGDADPYLGVETARRYAERLPSAELLELDDAGHWPWLDRPDLIGRVCGFLGRRPAGM